MQAFTTISCFAAGALVLGASAFADDQVPAICLNVANYAAQALGQTFTDGTWGTLYNPSSLRFDTNFTTYPISSAKYYADCEGGGASVPPSWCQVAGGAPVVYEVDFNKRYDASTTEPFAKVMVTFNRGGCWVDSASLQ